MGKKVELTGYFDYRFNGRAGHWSYRLNNRGLDPVLTEALEANNMVKEEPSNQDMLPHYSVGKVKITIEKIDD